MKAIAVLFVSLQINISHYSCYLFPPSFKLCQQHPAPIRKVTNVYQTQKDLSALDENTSIPAKSTLRRDLTLLFEKALDTAEDVVLHFRRYLVPYYQNPHNGVLDIELLDKINILDNSNKGLISRPRVVLVGSGWAAHAF